MKKVLTAVFVLTALFSVSRSTAQTATFKAAVFDIDIMVQALPEYRGIDSMTQIYERDTLGSEYQIYQSEYQRLDSTFKSDSAAGKAKAILDYTAGKRQEMAMNLVYWQQIAQRKSETKRGQLAQPLYVQVANAYQKVLQTKKYDLILKPQTYEFGFHIDNLFITVAKELKLTSLPQELLQLGNDPDAKTPAPGTGTKPPATGAKPKTN